MRDRCTSSWIALAAVLVLTAAPVSTAAESQEKPAGEGTEQKGPLRVEDLPKPVPKVMDKIKDVGNKVGEEISKASSKTASAVKKAFQGSKSKDKDKAKEDK